MSDREVTAALRQIHAADLEHTSGGWTWFCACGERGETGASYPTEGQANARLSQHLRAARRRVYGDPLRMHPAMTPGERLRVRELRTMAEAAAWERAQRHASEHADGDRPEPFTIPI